MLHLKENFSGLLKHLKVVLILYSKSQLACFLFCKSACINQTHSLPYPRPMAYSKHPICLISYFFNDLLWLALVQTQAGLLALVQTECVLTCLLSIQTFLLTPIVTYPHLHWPYNTFTN